MTKVISLSDEAYTALASVKGEGESFSDVVLELTAARRLQIRKETFGSWKMSRREYDSFMAGVHARREGLAPRTRKT